MPNALDITDIAKGAGVSVDEIRSIAPGYQLGGFPAAVPATVPLRHPETIILNGRRVRMRYKGPRDINKALGHGETALQVMEDILGTLERQCAEAFGPGKLIRVGNLAFEWR